MPQQDQHFDFTDLRGGRNQVDPWEAADKDQVYEALNVDYALGTVAHRRRGAVYGPGTTFSSGGPWGGPITSWTRYMPTAAETDAEVWAIDTTGLVARLQASTQWAPVSLLVPYIGNTTLVRWLTFNQKLFIFGNTGVNRLQVWDGNFMRLVGLAPPTAPALSSTPAGNVTDTRRYWASITVKKVPGGTIERRSELSPTYAEVPLSAQNAVMTLTLPPAEGETHWELWAATTKDDFGIPHFVADAPIGQPITDHFTDLTGISPAPVGTYLVPPAVKYCVADGDRLIMGGVYYLTTVYGQPPVKISRVWWTPRLGTLDIGDDERIVITVGNASIPAIRSYLDITEPLTGLGGPVQGSFYAFAYRFSYRLSPTGDVTKPYTRVPLGVPHGCIYDQGICLAEDEAGNSALYVIGIRGPWRIDNTGPVWCGWDVQDIWARVNLAATVPCILIYHADLHQVWLYLALDASTVPTERLVFDTRQGKRHETKGIVHGWTRADGSSCLAYAAAMLPRVIGPVMSRDLKPYISSSQGIALLQCDAPTTASDAGNPYQAYIQKVVVPPPAARSRVGNVWIEAVAEDALLTTVLTPDWEPARNKATTLNIKPKGTETVVWREFEDSALGDIQQSVLVYLGDPLPAAVPWTVNRWQILVNPEGDR